jgi:hypothetical protein
MTYQPASLTPDLKLGGTRAGAADISQYQAQGVTAAAAQAAERLADIADDLRALRDEGLSLNAMGRRLNKLGVLASRGGRWDATQVWRALARIARDLLAETGPTTARARPRSIGFAP